MDLGNVDLQTSWEWFKSMHCFINLEMLIQLSWTMKRGNEEELFDL